MSLRWLSRAVTGSVEPSQGKMCMQFGKRERARAQGGQA